jgi:hypothetical protein
LVSVAGAAGQATKADSCARRIRFVWSLPFLARFFASSSPLANALHKMIAYGEYDTPDLRAGADGLSHPDVPINLLQFPKFQENGAERLRAQ